MTDQVRHIGHGPGAITRPVFGNLKVHLQLALSAQRFDFDQHRQLRIGKQRFLEDLQRRPLIGHGAEQGGDGRFEFVQRFAAEHNQAHQVRRVVFVVERQQFVANLAIVAIGQRLQAAHGKAAEGMRGIHARLQRIETPPRIALEPHLILGFYRVALALDVARVHVRGDKELCKAIQGPGQVRGVDIEEVVGVFKAGVGIARAAVLGDKAPVLRGIRVFLSAEKEHVLQKMRQTGPARGVVPTADAHVHRGRRFGRIGIGNQQRLEPVIQGQQSIGKTVVGTLQRRNRLRGRRGRTGGQPGQSDYKADATQRTQKHIRGVSNPHRVTPR